MISLSNIEALRIFFTCIYYYGFNSLLASVELIHKEIADGREVNLFVCVCTYVIMCTRTHVDKKGGKFPILTGNVYVIKKFTHTKFGV